MPNSSLITIQHASSVTTYPITIQPKLLSNPSDIKQAIPNETLNKAKRALIVTDRNVGILYKASLTENLIQLGLKVDSITLPAGETSKCWAEAERIFQAALEHGITRHDVFIALGGGVIGDITGYCAATYHRGTPYIQIPTSLLAQVDSSVGGKVAIHVGGVKNSVGAFYHPAAVCIDPMVLSTLPSREWQAGFAEVIKYGLIEATANPTQPARFFDELCQFFNSSQTPEQYFQQLASSPESPLNRWIAHCCRLKQAVVQADETEQNGQRMILNLGHTFAHILESATQYTEFLHGEAVAIGLMGALHYANQHRMMPLNKIERVETLLKNVGLPRAIPPHITLSDETALGLLKKDKKNRSTWPPFILPHQQLGHVIQHHETSEEKLRAMLSHWINRVES
jgi:3-dehydroquinate synthase